MSTPHNSAEKGQIAKTVLMPGDPLRAKFIAENFLKNAVLVNNVRGVQGYTGEYGGKEISVMASGMGMPSIGIYSYELYHFYDVENIIRVGSAGALQRDLNLYDVVLAQGACTDSNYASQFALPGSFAPIASYSLLKRAASIAEEKKLSYHVGNVVSSDRFYGDVGSSLDWAKMGVLCVEMECAALYMNAARCGKNALGILTVSDSLVSGEETTAAERERSFKDMIILALETAKSYDESF